MNVLSKDTSPVVRRRLALFSADPAFRQQVGERLNALAVYDVTSHPLDDFLKAPPRDRPAMIVIDVGSGEILLNPGVAQARAAWGSVPLVAISGDLSPEQMRNLVRLNASDWLRRPLDGKEFLKAITSHVTGGSSRSHITTFIGASGGSGATSLALAAAAENASASAERAKTTCLVDLDFQQADCGAFLNLFSEASLDDVVANPQRLDIELLDVLKLERKPGFTIYSFERPNLPFEAGGLEFVTRLLDLVAFRFEDVFIDLPNAETPWRQAVLSASDDIYVVLEPNLVSVRHAKRLLNQLGQLRGHDRGIVLVVNKRKRRLFGNRLSRKELRGVFKTDSIQEISLDHNLLSEALDRAMLTKEVHARSRFNKEIARLVKGRNNVGAS